MVTGNRTGLTPSQQERLATALERCRRDNGLDVSVLVGDLDVTDPALFRAAAEQVHAGLGERSHHAVLIIVAPGQRKLEVITGPGARRRVPDRVAALAVMSMVSAFAGGDLIGGLLDGLRQIADAAGKGEPLPPLADSSAQLAISSGH